MKSQKQVFITGTSAGLGYGLAKYYLTEGWTVWGCSRRGNDALADLGQDRYRHLQFDLSLADFTELSHFIKEIPSLELAILNAGILGTIEDLRDAKLEELKHLMEVNLWSNKRVIDLILKHHPQIRQVVGISSGASINGNRGWGGYSLSKAALNMLMTLYADENRSIHFTSLAPGLIDSAMQDYLTGLPADDRYGSLERLKSAKGTPDMPKPEEAGKRIAEAIPYLKAYPSGSYLDVRKLKINQG